MNKRTIQKFTIQLLFAFGIIIPTQTIIASDHVNIKKSKAFIGIHTHEKFTDSMILNFYEKILIEKPKEFSPHFQIESSLNANGSFTFEIMGITEPGYIDIGMDKGVSGALSAIFELYLIEPGDSVWINLEKDSAYLTSNQSYTINLYLLGLSKLRPYTVSFSGRGCAKYKCRYDADINAMKTSSSQLIVGGKYNNNNSINSCWQTSIQLLNKYKDKISAIAYDILKSDFYSHYQYEKYYQLWSFCNNRKENLLKDSLRYFIKQCDILDTIKLTESAKAISKSYILFLLLKEKINFECAQKNRNEDLYYYLINNYKGILLDKLLSAYLVKNFKNLKNGQYILDDAINTIKDNFYLEKVRNLKTDLSNGAEAYKFVFPNYNDRLISLEDFKGKVVVVDFWFTGCGACQGYYKNQLSKVEDVFKNDSSLIFISISVDAIKSTWLKSVFSGNYTSLNAVNLYTDGYGINHPALKYYNIASYPTVILIDKKGKIYNVSQKELRNFETLSKAINSALNSN
jgi:thiol-disulfide isomerase/thioredoxin